ncbi:type II toxin-antitoxin system mRNA interferase toxin, RelE/StbE family [Candidatus Saccharibacteria bacterium CG_4_10_14_0_2_um_filter_52_9]|nr:MAG: type II toxin-antitoxin system mRNA interferase toxin, RelE/StbE family [Candidatus Saccharibacteria bacterium CG_4_10_14_0_2_um_filter_52_9]
MKNYQLKYRKSVAVAKDLRAIQKKQRQAIVKRIEALAQEPRPTGSTKLRGTKDLSRLRYGDYRVIYQIDEDVISILIIKIGHRKNV